MDNAAEKSEVPVDAQFTGPAPRFSGAISAVTGGPPEDINMMPANIKENEEKPPIFDGSDLSHMSR